MRNNFVATRYTSYLFYIIQGTLLNIAAILFVPLKECFGLSYGELGSLIAVNFATQILVDILLSKTVDKHGYRPALIISSVCAIVGYATFAWMPVITGKPYLWLIIGIIIMSIASGLLEITIGPMINALPEKAKGSNIALLHSFYAWGQLLTIVVTTLLLFAIGRENWHLIVMGWMIFPIVGLILSLIVPMPEICAEAKSKSSLQIIKDPMFIIFMLMIFLGAAAETIMTQWCSTFMEQAMGIDKVIGDLAGMSLFAVMLGLCRILSAVCNKKVKLHHFMLFGSMGAIVCYIAVATTNLPVISLVFCGLTGFATGMLWPGTLVFAADYFPKTGAWLFAYLAVAGDVGAMAAPWITGLIADSAGLKASMGISAIFPILCTLCIMVYLKRAKTNITK